MNPGGKRHGDARWLLVFNCQTLGLANCIGMAAPGVQLDYCDFPRFRKSPEELLQKISDYDLVITAPEFCQTEYADFGKLAPTKLVPIITFKAFHPDLCRVFVGESKLKGPLGDYHSALAVGAYVRGLSVADTLKLFNGKMFERLGYLDLWEQSKQRLLESFSAHGYDLAHAFRRWSSSSTPFMHSLDHPAIGCLRDVADCLVQAAGVGGETSALLPHDNLLNGPVFPVYEEIAEHYSVSGSYRFKIGGQYRHIGLREFVSASFACYDQHGSGALGVPLVHQRVYQKILQAIQ